MTRALVLVGLLVATLARAQTPAPNQVLPTSILQLKKCGFGRSAPGQDCWNPNVDRLEACRTRRGTFSQRPTTPPCPTALFIVTDCADDGCTAGGGSTICITRAVDAGTSWQSGPCGGGGTAPSTGRVLLTACTTGGSDNAAAIQSAYDTATPGDTLVVGGGKTCGIGTTVVPKSGVRLLCERGGTLKARSGLGASGMFASSSTLTDVSFEGCTFDANSQSGIEAINLTGSTARITIQNSTFKNGSGTCLVVLAEDSGSTSARDNLVLGSHFEGSNVTATNDCGLKLGGGETASGIFSVDGFNSVVDTTFRRMGGVSLWQVGESILGMGLTFQGVHRQAMLLEGTGGAFTNVAITCHDGSTLTLSDRYAAVTHLRSGGALGGLVSFTNLGTQLACGKAIVEALTPYSVLTISDSYLAGGGANDVATGTAGASSSTTTIVDSSKTWATSEFVDFAVIVRASGGGCGLSTDQRRWITGTTNPSTITFTPALPAQADSCTYEIVGPGGIVTRRSALTQIVNNTFNNRASDLALQDYDQVSLWDPQAWLVEGNAFATIHAAGHAGVRVQCGDGSNTLDADTGTADTSSTTTAIDDSGQGWVTDQFVGYHAIITGGGGCGVSAGTAVRITANDSDTLTLANALPAQADNCTFSVRRLNCGPGLVNDNTWKLQCPAAVCGSYPCIAWDALGPGTFDGQRVAGNEFASYGNAPQCVPLVGWDETFGTTDPGGTMDLSGACIINIPSTNPTSAYIGVGCSTTASEVPSAVTETFGIAGMQCFGASGLAATSSYTLRKNGVDTAMTCTPGTAALKCTATGTVRVVPGDTLDVRVTAASTNMCALPVDGGTAGVCTHTCRLKRRP